MYDCLEHQSSGFLNKNKAETKERKITQIICIKLYSGTSEQKQDLALHNLMDVNSTQSE